MNELTNNTDFIDDINSLLNYISQCLFNKSFTECNEQQQKRVINESENCI